MDTFRSGLHICTTKCIDVVCIGLFLIAQDGLHLCLLKRIIQWRLKLNTWCLEKTPAYIKNKQMKKQLNNPNPKPIHLFHSFHPFNDFSLREACKNRILHI